MKLSGVQFCLPTQSNALAHVTVILESEGIPLTINNCHILRSPSGNLWLGMPRHATHQATGGWLHLRTVELPREYFIRLQAEVLRAYQKWAATQTRHPLTPSLDRWEGGVR